MNYTNNFWKKFHKNLYFLYYKIKVTLYTISRGFLKYCYIVTSLNFVSNYTEVKCTKCDHNVSTLRHSYS